MIEEEKLYEVILIIAQEKNANFAFVNLEKAFNRVPKGIARWAMRKLNVDEWVIELTTAM